MNAPTASEAGRGRSTQGEASPPRCTCRVECPLTCTGIPSNRDGLDLLQEHRVPPTTLPRTPALRPPGPFRVCAVDRFERLAAGLRRCPDASGLTARLARAMNCLPPRTACEYRQVARAAVGPKSRLRKVCGLRCGFATSRMPSQQSRPIPPRVEHAGEGWRPFAVPKAAALHLWRAVSSGLSYMPHSLVMQRTKEHEVSEEVRGTCAWSPNIFWTNNLTA